MVGDLALRFIDRQGQECDTDLKERIIAIDLETFRNIPTKVTVASGKVKTEIVHAAIKGNLTNVLIVDYALGESLLNHV